MEVSHAAVSAILCAMCSPGPRIRSSTSLGVAASAVHVRELGGASSSGCHVVRPDRLTDYNNNPSFSPFKAANYAIAVLDTGASMGHEVFGPDINPADGIGDRIVYQENFVTPGTPANDDNGHGTRMAGIIAEMTNAKLIILKVLDFEGNANFNNPVSIEAALQWVRDHRLDYNIVAVNMSFGFGNFATDQEGAIFHDELAELAERNVACIANTGNFYSVANTEGNPNPQPGVQYPAADAAVIAVGATWAASWPAGESAFPAFDDLGQPFLAFDHTQVPDQVAAFGQRHSLMLDIMAPGASLTTPYEGGGTIGENRGTSGSAAHVTAAIALAQHLNDQFGYQPDRLNKTQLLALLQSTGVDVVDRDVADEGNENDNVINTNLTFKRLNIEAMAYKLFKPAVPDLVNTSDWGFSETDNKTYDLTPTFTGTAPMGSHVWLYLNGAQVGTFQVGISSTTYTIEPSSAVDAGPNQIFKIKVAENSSVPEANRSQFSPGISLNIVASDTLDPVGATFDARLSEQLVVPGSNSGTSRLEINWGTAPERALTKTGGGVVTIPRAGLDINNRTVSVTYNADGGTTVFAADMGVSGIPGVSTRVAQWSVNADATVNLETTQNFKDVKVEDAGLVTLVQNGNRVLVVDTFMLDAGGKLDLKDNDMIVHANVNPVINDLRYNELYAAIRTAFGTGVWDGTSGITSSIAATTGNTALGIIKNREFGFTTFVGHSINPSSILIKYTYFGDIDLNGQVDADDLTIFAENFGLTTGRNWGHGNFDFDFIHTDPQTGDVDADDLTIFANHFGLGIGNPL